MMGFQIRTAVTPLIILNAIFFMLQITLGRGFTESLMLVGEDVFTRPWILLTSMFLHGGLSHLLFNMYGLFLFGSLVERRIGARKFLFIYLASGLIAGFLSSFFYQAALGASGAVMGIVGILIILMPNLKLLLFFVFPMSLWIAGILWALIDIFGIFFSTGIANIAHLAGMGTGLLYGVFLKKKK